MQASNNISNNHHKDFLAAKGRQVEPGQQTAIIPE